MPEAPGRRVEHYAWLSEALQDGGIVLTASRRLARELRSAFVAAQMSRGIAAWPTPGVHYWQDWARSVLLQSATASSSRLISRNTSALLWERSLHKQLDGNAPGIGGLTQHAMTAWQRLVQWRLSAEHVAKSAATRDEHIFLHSMRDYQRRLRDKNWLDPEEWIAAATDVVRSTGRPLPEKVLLAGFDRLSPLARHLLEALQLRGCAAGAIPLQSAVPTTITVHAMPDVESELRAAGSWANTILSREPAARIAVVAADLSTNASRYERLLREGLAPGWQTGSPDFRQAVNVSYGRKLADYPAITVALLCLHWISSGLRSREVSVLLRSQFLGSHPGMEGGEMDMRLRALPDRLWSPAALAEALSDEGQVHGKGDCLSVVRILAAMQVRVAPRRMPSAWAKSIHEVLTDAGWPGSGVLQSDEFQLGNRWRELLNELAGLDLVLSAVTFAEAVQRLAALAREAVYQPESGPGLVSLLGALEAAGMEFDYLWIIGVDSGRWPAPSNPLTLVSRALQRKHAMPDATPTDTLEFSRLVLQRLFASAGHVHCSWARAEADTRQMRSPLLRHFEQDAEPGIADPGWYAQTQLGKAGAAPVQDDPVPAVEGIERLSGGSRTVALQWQEPFGAFACGRLGVAELAPFQSGLTPRLRGDLMHDTLDILLRGRPSQEAQRAWSDDERRMRIGRAIERAVRRYEAHADAVLRRLLALEKRRLRAMLDDFLLAERERLPFRIERVEERLEFEHAGLLLTLRADRIDRLGDGSVAILDYKSGRPRKLLASDGEPIEPQLLVYATATTEVVGALVLVNINRRAIDYKGAGGEWRGVDPALWVETLGAWKAHVYRALESIARGDVRLNLHPGSGVHSQLDVLSRAAEERRAR